MQPCLVPAGSPIGQLEGVTNMVVLEGDFVGRIVLSGPGRGRGADRLGDRRRRDRHGARARHPAVRAAGGRPRRGAARRRRRRGRRPTTCASWSPTRRACSPQVAAALGEAGISINRMRQVEHDGAEAPVLIVTHRTERRGARRARSAAIAGARRLPRGAGGDPDRGALSRGARIRAGDGRDMARGRRRSMPTTCCTGSRPSRRCRPTPPRWRARRADVPARGLP